MLSCRDKAIIKDLTRFRVMDRDSIAELHFSNLNKPEKAANNVLLRLLRDGEIQRTTKYTPYLYFGPDVQIKKNSRKIGHFLAILNTYKEIRKHGKIESFLVEPKYGKKGGVEPDVYMYFRQTPFFIEVQNSIYSQKQMEEKLERYIDLFNSGYMATPFPHVLILSEQRYALDADYPFKVFQAETFSHFINSMKREKAPKVEPAAAGIRIKIG